jgi:hypothetical protein
MYVKDIKTLKSDKSSRKWRDGTKCDKKYLEVIKGLKV